TAIGARTTESQTHREMASGLSMPVGFKNGTDGSLSVAIQAMLAAAHPHAFLGVDDDGRVGVVRTAGNPYTHLVLRGGSGGPNYGRKAVEAAAAQAKEAGVPQGVMIGSSHCHSGDDDRDQLDVGHAVGQEVEAGPN